MRWAQLKNQTNKTPKQTKNLKQNPNDNMQRKENEKTWDFSINVIWKESREVVSQRFPSVLGMESRIFS